MKKKYDIKRICHHCRHETTFNNKGPFKQKKFGDTKFSWEVGYFNRTVFVVKCNNCGSDIPFKLEARSENNPGEIWKEIYYSQKDCDNYSEV